MAPNLPARVRLVALNIRWYKFYRPQTSCNLEQGDRQQLLQCGAWSPPGCCLVLSFNLSLVFMALAQFHQHSMNTLLSLGLSIITVCLGGRNCCYPCDREGKVKHREQSDLLCAKAQIKLGWKTVFCKQPLCGILQKSENYFFQLLSLFLSSEIASVVQR